MNLNFSREKKIRFGKVGERKEVASHEGGKVMVKVHTMVNIWIESREDGRKWSFLNYFS